jgi:hypothetical protein
MEDNYAIEFAKICDKLNKMVLDKKWVPASTVVGGCLAWATDNAPGLSKQEEKLYDKINVLWMNGMDFEEFKKKLMDWGRVVLNIYKKHHEVMAVKEA